MLVSLLCLIFAPAVDRTGAKLFWTRERASETLAAWWPLSEPALRIGRQSADIEVRKRCERATPETWREDVAAAVLVAHRSEWNGLPLADPLKVPSGRPDAIRRAVIRLANANGIDTSDYYYFGEAAFWAHPTGYDFVRLKMRGVWPEEARTLKGIPSWLPVPMQDAWSKQKGR